MASDEQVSRQRLLTMQIIAAALPTGVILFFGIAMFVVYGPGGAAAAQQQSMPIISIMAGGFFVITGVMSFFVPQMMTQNILKLRAASAGEDDVVWLLGVHQTRMIVGLALLEGSAFFGLVAFLAERHPLVLSVPGLAIVGMLARFPTENSVHNWLEMNERRLQELRQERA